MKIAIVHDYIKEYGGAERVLETLLEIYPDATVYTSLYAPEFLGPHRERFEKFRIRTTFLNSIPFRHKLISPLRLLSPSAFSSLDLSDYDVVIVSQTGAYFPNMIKTKPSTGSGKNNSSLSKRSESKGSGAVHICYTHTPPRYLYGYKTARDWSKSIVLRSAGALANHFLRMTDFNSSKNVDFFIANSEEVAGRIKKFYRRNAAVIYPPVEVYPSSERSESRSPSTSSGKISSRQARTIKEYYLTGGRLARAKGIDVIVKAFNENGLPLKIFGKGFAGFEEELRSLAKENIEFVGEASDEEKLDLMKNAKAFIFASYDEDFGITPVEAMSVGTPVIAYKSGGVKETVLQSRTGLFFDENTPDALNNAIRKFEEILRSAQNDNMRRDCIKQAEKFSAARFKNEIEKFINSKIK